MKILGIVPARGGSKAVPWKNIRVLENKPLLAYTARAITQATLLTKTIISSDSEEIIETAKKYDLDAPFTRPKELALDNTPTLQVIQHAINYFENQDESFDVVCVLQPTYPFRTPGFIDICIRRFIETGADTLLSAIPVPHQYNPHWIFEMNSEGWLHISTGDKKIVSRRQELPEAFARDGNVYLIKNDVIMKQDTLFGKKIAHIMSDPFWHVNIDTEQDWSIAENKAAEYVRTFPF